MSGFNDALDYRNAFGGIAVEQPLITVTAQVKVKLPNQIPNIMQPGIHALPAKRAMDVGRVASNEDASYAQLGDVPVMNAKVTAPVKRARLEPSRPALGEYPLYELERRSIAFRFFDCRH